MNAPTTEALAHPRVADLADDGEAFVPLAVTGRLHGDPERVAAMLDAGSPSWLRGMRARPSAGGTRRYEVDLRLRVGVGQAAVSTFRKAAYLDLGPAVRTPDGWELDISWRAASAAPLFPVFAGCLVIGPRDLRIEGLYAPPGGAVGRAADRLLLHVAANATARWLLAEIDRAALGAAG